MICSPYDYLTYQDALAHCSSYSFMYIWFNSHPTYLNASSLQFNTHFRFKIALRMFIVYDFSKNIILPIYFVENSVIFFGLAVLGIS